MKNIFKKSITFALAFTLVITMCFGSAGSAQVYAADAEEPAALSVYDGERLVKQYTLDDLREIAKSEGDIQYKFSGYNRNRTPSFYTYGDDNARPDVRECFGPTVKGILDDAGIQVEGDQKITFLDNLPNDTGYRLDIIAADLYESRYYYPEADGIEYGDAAPESAYKNAEPVPAIIDIHDDDDTDEYVETVVRFGQHAPNERNVTFFNKTVANGGKIIVGDAVTDSWEPVTTPVYSSGTVLPETAIEFDTKYIDNKYAAANVYYTVAYSSDGTAPQCEEPGPGACIYNYNREKGKYPPVLEKEGTYTVKVKVIGYGKLASETTSFTYKVEDVPGPERINNDSFLAGLADADSAALEWQLSEDADGYEVLKYNEDTEKYEVTADVEEVSYTDNGLSKGGEYSYKVRAYKLLDSGQKVYSSATAAKSVFVPDLKAPEMKSAERTAYSSIQIKWSKVSDAEGYRIYRYDAGTKKYALIKTINDNSIVSYTDKGLKTGTKYSYKIKSYVTMLNGKKLCSAGYSNVKSAKPYLTKPALSSAARKSYNSIQIKWSKISGASGYEVYRSVTGKSGSYRCVKTVKDGSASSYINEGLKTGKKYYYKVKAYRLVDGKKVYSDFSNMKSAVPSLAKPVIAKLSPGKKSITVKWNKISGASGYKIYRSTKKDSGYKCVKTITKGSVVSWKNTKLTKGKKYYYKVKAYRTVDKKNVYSSYSLSKYTKAK